MLSLMLLILACTEGEEVITGVPQEALLSSKPSAEEVRQDSQRETRPTNVYVKPEGVDVDVFQLTGKMFSAVQGDLIDQMGDFVAKYPIQQKNGERRIYERGEILVDNGQIYMMEFKLQEPMRRAEALKAAGFPKFVDKYVSLRKRWQLNNQWDFKRIRMKKEDSPKSEMVVEFEAYKWEPKERVRR